MDIGDTNLNKIPADLIEEKLVAKMLLDHPQLSEEKAREAIRQMQIDGRGWLLKDRSKIHLT